jgi:NTP pyrophosphatase (non-canonical NTP hydrolase)
MTMDEYDREADKYALHHDDPRFELLYLTLKLNGEAGEFAEKLGKCMRDGTTPELEHGMLLELGDVLWYTAALARRLNSSLEEIAALNLHKIADRAGRGKIHGTGDYR